MRKEEEKYGEEDEDEGKEAEHVSRLKQNIMCMRPISVAADQSANNCQGATITMCVTLLHAGPSNPVLSPSSQTSETFLLRNFSHKLRNAAAAVDESKAFLGEGVKNANKVVQ